MLLLLHVYISSPGNDEEKSTGSICTFIPYVIFVLKFDVRN